jgi:hypothetical protein
LLLAELAREMAGAINDVVPPGFTVMASWVTEDPMVILVHEGGGLQDEIVESLGTPWPQTTESKGLPLNGTRLERDFLRGWYGAGDNPVLALRPILAPKSGS